MNKFVDGLINEENKTTTENGDFAYKSTKSALLDFFYKAGSIRIDQNCDDEDVENIIELWENAFDEDPKLAIAGLFWLRDVRGGAGQRESFRRIVNNVITKKTKAYNYIVSILNQISEYGRWDDLWKCGTIEDKKLYPILNYLIRNGLSNISTRKLVAKWLPREHGKNKELANIIASILNMTPRNYRKLCSANSSDLVEVKMSAKKWNEIIFEHVPSLAMSRYTNAFNEHCEDRFEEYKFNLAQGKTKINASALYPYQCLLNVYSDLEIAEAQWKALPNYIPEGISFMPLVDISGSMGVNVGPTSAMNIAISLGMYCAERQKGAFKDLFITFSEKPTIVKIPANKNLAAKLNFMRAVDWGYNTDIVAAMNLILDIAVFNDVSQSDLPKILLIMSDMQFDANMPNVGMQQTFFAKMKLKFEDAGYTCPKIVYWNLNGRYNNVPENANVPGVTMVSGFSPSILKHILNDEEFTPYEQMLEVLTSERYKPILESLKNL